MSIRQKPRLLHIGSVSHDTTRNEDLIPTFLDVCEGLRLSGSHLEDKRIIRDRYRAGMQASEEQMQADVEILIDVLNAHAPDYCYFGAHDTDPADFGTWPGSEVPFHGPATDDIGKGAELPPANAEFPDHFLIVNDRGNCTLYRKRRQGRNHRWVECWSIV